MPMRARWWHQLGDAIDQLQWGEHQFTRVFVGLQRLGVAFATAAVVLPLSANILPNPSVHTLRLNLALPPISETITHGTTSDPHLASDLYIAGVNDDQWGAG